ncbi:MAG: hypothetical protein H6621_04960 [Halobacteriovoraceae bacterium]|nr:hypothetical protein [Halobacteriovoraceae bacterium]
MKRLITLMILTLFFSCKQKNSEDSQSYDSNNKLEAIKKTPWETVEDLYIRQKTGFADYDYIEESEDKNIICDHRIVLKIHPIIAPGVPNEIKTFILNSVPVTTFHSDVSKRLNFENDKSNLYFSDVIAYNDYIPDDRKYLNLFTKFVGLSVTYSNDSTFYIALIVKSNSFHWTIEDDNGTYKFAHDRIKSIELQKRCSLKATKLDPSKITPTKKTIDDLSPIKGNDLQ